GDVADGHQVFDLQRGERGGDLVETELVALQGGERLVGAGEDLARVFEHVARLTDVDGDDLHRLRHGDDRQTGLAGDAVDGAVTRAGLVGVDRVVGHQVDRGPVDLVDVLVEDQGTVHLRQLAQAGGGEGDVEGEA